MVHDRAIGAVQGHAHGLRPRGQAAGALLLHILDVNGVHSFAGTLSLAVMNVHFLLGLTISHFDVLHLGCDVFAIRLLTCVTAGAWNFHDFASFSQTLVFIEWWAARDPLLPDVLSSLVDPTQMTITAILECLILLQGHDPSSS